MVIEAQTKKIGSKNLVKILGDVSDLIVLLRPGDLAVGLDTWFSPNSYVGVWGIGLETA